MSCTIREVLLSKNDYGKESEMPTTYTHDLFGKLIYRQLPVEMKRIIRKNGDLYRIGLHGPDIFFYHLLKPGVNGAGVQMHHEPAAPFFQRGMKLVRERGDEKLLAYLLGFGCHYLLDSACHPFVDEMAKKRVISHTLLEKELDRTLMLETNRNPHHFYPSDCIVPKISYARVIHRVFPQIKTKDILFSLKMMKFLTNAMVYDNRGRRRLLLRIITGMAGRKASVSAMDHFMRRDPAPGSEKPVEELHGLFDQAVQEHPQYLEELFSLSKEELLLSERWYQTYNG